MSESKKRNQPEPLSEEQILEKKDFTELVSKEVKSYEERKFKNLSEDMAIQLKQVNKKINIRNMIRSNLTVRSLAICMCIEEELLIGLNAEENLIKPLKLIPSIERKFNRDIRHIVNNFEVGITGVVKFFEFDNKYELEDSIELIIGYSKNVEGILNNKTKILRELNNLQSFVENHYKKTEVTENILKQLSKFLEEMEDEVQDAKNGITQFGQEVYGKIRTSLCKINEQHQKIKKQEEVIEESKKTIKQCEQALEKSQADKITTDETIRTLRDKITDAKTKIIKDENEISHLNFCMKQKEEEKKENIEKKKQLESQKQKIQEEKKNQEGQIISVSQSVCAKDLEKKCYEETLQKQRVEEERQAAEQRQKQNLQDKINIEKETLRKENEKQSNQYWFQKKWNSKTDNETVSRIEQNIQNYQQQMEKGDYKSDLPTQTDLLNQRNQDIKQESSQITDNTNASTNSNDQNINLQKNQPNQQPQISAQKEKNQDSKQELPSTTDKTNTSANSNGQDQNLQKNQPNQQPDVSAKKYNKQEFESQMLRIQSNKKEIEEVEKKINSKKQEQINLQSKQSTKQEISTISQEIETQVSLLSKLKQVQYDLEKDIQNFSSNLNQDIDSQIKNMDETIKNAEDYQKQLTGKVQEINEDIKKQNNDIADKNNDIQKANDQIEDNKDKLEEIKIQINEEKANLKNNEKILQDFYQVLEKLRMENDQFMEQYSQLYRLQIPDEVIKGFEQLTLMIGNYNASVLESDTQIRKIMKETKELLDLQAKSQNLLQKNAFEEENEGILDDDQKDQNLKVPIVLSEVEEQINNLKRLGSNMKNEYLKIESDCGKGIKQLELQS